MLTLFILGVVTPILVFVVLDVFHFFDEKYDIILKIRNKLEMLDADEALRLDEVVIKREKEYNNSFDKIMGY